VCVRSTASERARVGNAMMTTTARKSTSVPSALASNTDMRGGGGGGGLPRELAQVNRRQAMCRSNDSALRVWLLADGLDGWLVGILRSRTSISASVGKGRKRYRRGERQRHLKSCGRLSLTLSLCSSSAAGLLCYFSSSPRRPLRSTLAPLSLARSLALLREIGRLGSSLVRLLLLCCPSATRFRACSFELKRLATVPAHERASLATTATRSATATTIAPTTRCLPPPAA